MLGVTGLLVSTLALRQFDSIVAPVLLALVLVIGVDPLTGILSRRGVPRERVRWSALAQKTWSARRVPIR